jgi:hypothetical protein
VSALDALADASLYSELEERFPNGPALKRLNAHAVREVVRIMRDRIRELGLRLQLRAEPLHFPACGNNGLFVPAPTRLVIRDADLMFQVPIETHETFCMIDDKVVATGNRRDGVRRIVHAIHSAITRKIHD